MWKEKQSIIKINQKKEKITPKFISTLEYAHTL